MSKCDQWENMAQLFGVGLAVLTLVAILMGIGLVKLGCEYKALKKTKNELAEIHRERDNSDVVRAAAYNRLAIMHEDLQKENRLQAAEIRNLKRELRREPEEGVDNLLEV